MTEGDEHAGESLLIYKNPKVPNIPPNSYTKIMPDPVLFFRGPNRKCTASLSTRLSSWPTPFMR